MRKTLSFTFAGLALVLGFTADTASVYCNAQVANAGSAAGGQDNSNSSQGAYRVGGGISAPKVLYGPDPEYSEKARKAKYQGTVVLWLVVDADGLPQKIRVQRPLGMGLDEEAIKAVQRWRFQPALKDGNPVPVMINVEVNFRLYEDLMPHPDSQGQVPRFPGVDTSQYPLVARLVGNPTSVTDPSMRSYVVTVIDAGQERQLNISCNMGADLCAVLRDGTYPARWLNGEAGLEILGLRGGKGKWVRAEYVVGTGTKSSQD